MRNSEVLSHVLVGASDERRMLVGAYLTQEFAFESAALTNPSMVPAPDQAGLADGELRVVLSLRSIGEGHISSIEFREGVLAADGSMITAPASEHAETGERRSPVYERKLFASKLNELGAHVGLVARVLDELPRHFDGSALERALSVLNDQPRIVVFETIKLIRWLASSNYVLEFDEATSLSERLVWPESPFESRGMEDARFVRFVEDDGTSTYYATYTAFNGFQILPQLMETNDFRTFEISTLNGASAQNKGMALFPRLINGRYSALSRSDGVNIHVITSDNPRFWGTPSQVLRRPQRPWELVQMGNCGSPIETEHGWLVLTHGVGPMRTYQIGAVLLDLDHPEQVVADLPDPILHAGADERDGYVPNVVYSCGGLVHGDRLCVPFGVADQRTAFTSYSVSELLDALVVHRPRRKRAPD